MYTNNGVDSSPHFMGSPSQKYLQSSSKSDCEVRSHANLKLHNERSQIVRLLLIIPDCCLRAPSASCPHFTAGHNSVRIVE